MPTEMRTSPGKRKVNPLSRRARHHRLVMAIRGGAGVGKSYFASTMANAGLGRLCFFDVERKSRLLPGVGTVFDGLEIEHPDELPEFIDWALTGEGRDQRYGCFVLDSWAAYFGAKHGETIAAVKARESDPLAQPTAEELAADQMLLQGVLRRLCMESGKSVVILDQIPAKGKEAKEDNEVGRVLPMTASGLEYFVDIMVELSLQERDGDIVRVFQVVKSNSPAFAVGFEMVGDATFKDFLDHLTQESGSDFAIAAASSPDTIEDATEGPAADQSHHLTPLTLTELVDKAVAHGFQPADLVTAARYYHNQPNLQRLRPEQIDDLDRRLTARIAKLARKAG